MIQDECAIEAYEIHPQTKIDKTLKRFKHTEKMNKAFIIDVNLMLVLLQTNLKF